LWILAMALSSTIAPTSRLMTLKVIIPCIKWVTTTLATKLVLSSHVKIGSQWNFWHKGIPPFSPYIAPTFLNEGIHDILNGILCGYLLTSKWATN
jgi:hypothetical protein